MKMRTLRHIEINQLQFIISLECYVNWANAITQ
jgi:hypothetical protein